MNLYAARDLARALMNQHNLADWHFVFDHARRRFGSCQPRRKRITLSRMLTLLNEVPEVRDTILHEIAHALTPGDGHANRWKAACVKVGARPIRCYSDDAVASPPRRPARFQIGCPSCGWWADRHRRTRRKLVCRSCRREIVLRLANPANLLTN
jgi:predicted SprT family Zn-dependent metalloprotease